MQDGYFHLSIERRIVLFLFFFFYFDYFVLNLATRPSKVGWSSYSAYRVKIDKQWNI